MVGGMRPRNRAKIFRAVFAHPHGNGQARNRACACIDMRGYPRGSRPRMRARFACAVFAHPHLLLGSTRRRRRRREGRRARRWPALTDQPLTAAALAAALLAHANAPPRLTLSKAEAATCLGVSVDFFEAHIQPDLRVVREGRLVLIPVAELERWVTEHARQTLG